MSKSKEELNKLKEEIASVDEKLQELTPEELEQVNGGAIGIGKAIEFKAKVGMQIYLPEL